jgi:hypothetical protein
MQMPRTGTADGRALLILLAESKPCTDWIGVAKALGMPPVVFDKLAQRAYPLSPGDSAAEHLLRDIGNILAARTRMVGLEAALAGLAEAASGTGPTALLDYLAQSLAAPDPT